MREVDIEEVYEERAATQDNFAQLGQVCLNIIQNAIEALEGQGKIAVRTYAVDSQVVFECRDPGPGMPEPVR